MNEKPPEGDNIKDPLETPKVIKPEPVESVEEKTRREKKKIEKQAKSKEKDESELTKVRSRLGLPEQKVAGREKKKKNEAMLITEVEVIDMLNSGEFYDDAVSKIWDRYCVQCYKEAKAEAESPGLVDALYDQKRFDTISKTKFANPKIKDFKGYVAVIKASINKKSAIERVEEAQNRIDPDDNTSGYLDGPKKPKESLLNSGSEVTKIEELINEFGIKHDLNALLAIGELLAEDVSNNNMRNAAKLDLVVIQQALSSLINNTNVATEKYNELNRKFDALSKAVGIINRGKVEHR